MGRIYLVPDRVEIDRRKKLVEAGPLIEVWQDLHADDVFWIGDEETRRRAYASPEPRTPTGLLWIGEESKAALDRAGEPLPFALAVREEAVPVYYGPRLADVESLPSEESLKARVLSAHGVAVVWATYDPSGRRNQYQPASPTDPTFYLRRPRGAVAHLWRLFATRADALAYATQHLAEDPEATEWAGSLPCDDFGQLVERFGERE